jgi:sugar diacid utilization regulator
MGKPKALDIVRRLSLKFNKHISVAYLVPKSQNDDFDLNRIYRNYYVSKTLKSKVIVAKYNDGIFIVTTSNKDDKKSHDIILREALDTLSIDIDKLTVSFSDILSPFEDFDLAFKESFYASIGARIMNVGKLDYSSLGALRLLIPLSDDSSSLEFSDYYLSKFADNREYYDTAINYIKNGGDMAATAVEMSCHINTIRYRLSKIRELTGDTNITEYEFYENLSLAITIMNIRQVKTYFARNDLPYDNPLQHK